MSVVRLRGIRRFHWARDMEEALSLIAAYDGRGALLAGGVDLARSACDLEGLIDITGIGLSYMQAGHVGSAVATGRGFMGWGWPARCRGRGSPGWTWPARRS